MLERKSLGMVRLGCRMVMAGMSNLANSSSGVSLRRHHASMLATHAAQIAQHGNWTRVMSSKMGRNI